MIIHLTTAEFCRSQKIFEFIEGYERYTNLIITLDFLHCRELEA